MNSDFIVSHFSMITHILPNFFLNITIKKDVNINFDFKKSNANEIVYSQIG